MTQDFFMKITHLVLMNTVPQSGGSQWQVLAEMCGHTPHGLLVGQPWDNRATEPFGSTQTN